MALTNISSTIQAMKESLEPNKGIVVLATVLSMLFSMSSLIGLTALVPVVALIAGQDVSQLEKIPYIGSLILSMTDNRSLIFYTMIGAILTLSITRAILAVCSSMVEARARRRVDGMWQERIVEHWIDAPYEFHNSEARAEIQHLTSREAQLMGQSARAFVQIISSGIQISFALIFLAFVSIEALLGVSIVLALIMIPLSIVVQRNFSVAAEVQESAASYTRNIHQVIRRIDLIDVFGTSEKEKQNLVQVFAEYLRSRVKMQLYRSLAPFFVHIFMSVILAALLIYFFNLGATATTLATVVLFLGGVTIMHPHVDKVGQALTNLTRVAAAYDAIQTIVQLPRRPMAPDNARPHPDFRQHVAEVKDLSFAYQTSNGPLPILKHVDLVIEPGQLIMLFGATGTGKTTFLRLMQGLLAPDKGSILYGGVDLADLSKQSIGRTILMMQQDGLTFTGTIRENVAYGLDDLSEQRLMKALRMAAAEDFVNQLPEGVDTHIGNDGALLSGGQRQRVTLARIIAASPPIMLLDEPTSSLDREVEHEVIKSLFELRNQGHTLLMSTHKVELAPLADTVLWFDGHKIVSGQFEDFQHSLTELVPHDKMRHILTTSQAI